MLYHKEKSHFISDGNSLTSFYRLGKLVLDFRLVKTGFHETHFWLKKKKELSRQLAYKLEEVSQTWPGMACKCRHIQPHRQILFRSVIIARLILGNWPFRCAIIAGTTIAKSNITRAKMFMFLLLIKNKIQWFQLFSQSWYMCGMNLSKTTFHGAAAVPRMFFSILVDFHKDLFQDNTASQKKWHSFVFEVYFEIQPGLDLSFWSTIVKIYPFANLCWVNKDENI